jgi:uncharacterized protein
MYLISELILFSPLIIYACLRIRRLIPKRSLKRLFVAIFLLLFFGYPLAESLSHREAPEWARPIIILGYFCLPYLLYITLSVITIDLAIVLMRRIRVFSPEGAAGKKYQFVRLGCYLAIPALVVFVGAWNNNRIRTKQYSIELPHKSSKLDRLKIVFASDFHLSQITSKNLLNRFVSKVNELNPDIVLIGGDILEGHGVQNLAGFEAQFRGIKAKYGVYAAPGNHERNIGSRDDFFVQSGMKLLEDRVERIDNAFYLAGRSNGRLLKKKPIEDLLESTPDDLPIILLDHSPTDLENVSRSRVNLQLSGHTHNGQLFPINFVVMPFQYELAWGIKKKQNTIFIVSSGLQAWGPPVKTAGNSEIILIKAEFR